jgi:hypothetical protein
MKGNLNVGLVKFMCLVLFLLLQASPGGAEPLTVVLGKKLILESGNTGEVRTSIPPGCTRPTVLEPLTDGKQASAHVVATGVNQGGGASATIGLQMSIQPGQDGRVEVEAEFTILVDYYVRIDVPAAAYGGMGRAWFELCYDGIPKEEDMIQVVPIPNNYGHTEMTKSKTIKFKQNLSTTGYNTIQFFNIHADGIYSADTLATATIKEITIKFTPPKTYGLFVGIDYPVMQNKAPLHGDQGAKMVMDNWAKLGNIGRFDYLPGWFNVGGIGPGVIQAKINQFSSIKQGDNFVFYFSGHGGINPDNQKEYLLIGTTNSANVEDTMSWVVLYKDELANWLKALDDKGINIWVIMDACKSGGFWDGALENLKHVGLIASATKGADSVSDLFRQIGIFEIALAADLDLQSRGNNTWIDTNQDGLISFSELASRVTEGWSNTTFVRDYIDRLVFIRGLGDPVIFSLDMWNPIGAKSTDFNGAFSGEPMTKKALPWLMLLLD